MSAAPDGRSVELESTLADGVVLRHQINAGADDVTFRITATNPTDKPSEADWAQPCLRVGPFTGGDKQTYLTKCFIFLDGKLAPMPTADWATEALYAAGQVCAAPGVNRDDVNPRPLSPRTPDKGRVGCYSADGRTICATAFEPYQELFPGIAACLHSDFRIGGLKPGETNPVRPRRSAASSTSSRPTSGGCWTGTGLTFRGISVRGEWPKR